MTFKLEPISNHGIDIPFLIFPLCENAMEDGNHVFVFCEITVQVWSETTRWVDSTFPPPINIVEFMSWVDTVPFSRNKRKALDVIILLAIWMLWRYRNNAVFPSSNFPTNVVMEKIILNLFEWFTSRNKNILIQWYLWLQNSLLNIYL